MKNQQKKLFKETADELRRMAERMRDNGGAMTPESRLAIAGSYALQTLAHCEDNDGVPRVDWTHEMCKHAMDSVNGEIDKPIDFQN